MGKPRSQRFARDIPRGTLVEPNARSQIRYG
jgi:hypothetical protein